MDEARSSLLGKQRLEAYTDGAQESLSFLYLTYDQPHLDTELLGKVHFLCL